MQKQKHLGFTLVELLIVIAIMGILATVSFIALSQVKDRARDAARISEVNQIRKILDIYYSDHGHYPPFSITSWGENHGWPENWELARNWGDVLKTLHDDGVFLDTPELDSAGYYMNIQDPLYDPDGHANSYQYMPSANPTTAEPNSFRIRVQLENRNNPVLESSYDGYFLWTDGYPGDGSCDSDLGYYCIGPREDFSAFVSGKPVIYLYPTEKTEVAVKVTTKKITESIPDYNDGWNVTAYPDGTIINSEDGETYPYLFWEGPSYKPFVDKEKGFVVKTEEMELFLAEKLAAQGLEAKEYAEFIEFWAPRMKDKDYAYVYFMPQADYDELIPMEITPQPDTIIRVYMLYKSLDEPIEVEAQELTAPERDGFTVVEWGGDLKELK
jgi:prepilin-type N-terminal cleavage/methylation domain-containing protein